MSDPPALLAAVSAVALPWLGRGLGRLALVGREGSADIHLVGREPALVVASG